MISKMKIDWWEILEITTLIMVAMAAVAAAIGLYLFSIVWTLMLFVVLVYALSKVGILVFSWWYVLIFWLVYKFLKKIFRVSSTNIDMDKNEVDKNG